MDKSETELQQLIEKLQDGSITPEEEALLLDWYEQLNVTEMPVWENAEREIAVKNSLRDSIRTRLHRNRISRLNSLNKRTWWAAAAIILILSSVWLLQRTANTPQITKNSRPLAWTTIGNDGSAVKKIELPDGSTAWLNTSSHLRYNDQFGKNNRLLVADGEILLDVRHDTATPFRVITKNITTTVLGTLFNIEAYPDEKEIKVSLLRGKIRIADSLAGERILRPGEMAASSRDIRLTVSEMENINSDAWIRGSLVFNETLLSDAFHRIERRYKVQFAYAPGLLTGERITTVISEERSWPSVLQNMLFIHNIHFKRSGNLIRLYR